MSEQKSLIKLDFSPQTIELIKSQIAVGCTDDELQLFLYQARRSGLDPLARQIYMISRQVYNPKTGYKEHKATIQASIDGLRLVAQRSPDYAGQDEPEWLGAPKTPDFHAKVKVFKFSPKGDRYCAAVGVAYWSEYAQVFNGKLGSMWEKMPRLMLAKTAEALALRKAFPQELSGIYTQEEMDQSTPIEPKQILTADEERSEKVLEDAANYAKNAYNSPKKEGLGSKTTTTATPPKQEPKITDWQRKKIFALAGELGKESESVKETIKKHFNLEHFNDLTLNQAGDVILDLQKKLKAKKEKENQEILTPEEEAEINKQLEL